MKPNDIKPSGMIGPDKQRQFPEDMYLNVPWPYQKGWKRV